MTESRSGLSVTPVIGFQLRVCRVQRRGWAAFALHVYPVPGGKNVSVLAGMASRRTDVADAAMFVIVVVPVDEGSGPQSCFLQVRKPFRRELGAILGGAEQGLDESIVVAHTRP
jgi:hypothetical protein